MEQAEAIGRTTGNQDYSYYVIVFNMLMRSWFLNIESVAKDAGLANE